MASGGVIAQYLFLNKIPDQIGYLVIGADDGAVLFSAGELQNNDRFASTIFKMVNLASGSSLINSEDNFRRLTIVFEKHFYAITVFGKKIFVVKRKPHETTSANVV